MDIHGGYILQYLSSFQMLLIAKGAVISSHRQKERGLDVILLSWMTLQVKLFGVYPVTIRCHSQNIDRLVYYLHYKIICLKNKKSKQKKFSK